MRYRQDNNPKRHKLIRRTPGESVPPGGPKIATAASVPPAESVPPDGARIETVEQLRGWLQKAIDVEHFTIPPYLCALWSLKDGLSGPNSEAYRIIRSVVMEEMLHMILAANILNAVGGTPRIIPDPKLRPYPKLMPYSAIGFQVDLLKFSKGAVNTFLRIERPAERVDSPPDGEFWSIGEMYATVREALNRLDREAREKNHRNGIFTGAKDRQVTEEQYYGGGGKLFAVCCVDDANLAMDEIVGQGEGVDGSIDDGDDAMFAEDAEPAHYFRFNEIFCERRYRPGDQPNTAPSGDAFPVDWDAVYDMVPNPTMDMFKSRPRVRKKVEAFNATYSRLLRNIEAACNGSPAVLGDGVPFMYALRDQAVELMNEEIGIADLTAGPSFEYIP
jgi:hypothetical protein